MSKTKPFRVGDIAIITNPAFVERVGYPKTLADYLVDVRHNRQALLAYLATMSPFERKFVEMKGLKLLAPSVTPSDKALKKLENEVAYLLAKADGFGGRARTIHYKEVPAYRGSTVRILGIRTAVTGTYRSACTGYYGPDDYEPAGLDDEKRHRIAEVSVLSRSINWDDSLRMLGTNGFGYPQIEVSNLSHVDSNQVTATPVHGPVPVI